MATDTRPKVLIVGAGLGGLMLGALLEKAGVPYAIFERTSVVKPLGSALSLGSNVLPLFTQLGIFDDFMTLGKNVTHCTISRENKGPLVTLDFLVTEELSGYSQYVIARPLLYDLLLKQVPPHKIHFNKRILKIKEGDNKVTIQAADNTVHEGDILVGADGAYSAVRQRLYEQLKMDGKLPKSDQEDLPFSCTCLVGQTKRIDFEQVFPEFKDPGSTFYNTLGDSSPFTYVVFSTAQETVTWMVIHHLDRISSKTAEEHRFKESENSEWGPLAAQAMCDETRHLPLPIGTTMTMGDIYELTPKEQISKVMLEEKVFKTWYSGRTVLVGDACHKLDPAGGHGAVTSMHDALAIANVIYALPSNPTTKDIEQAFADYQAERRPAAVDAFKNSQAMAKFMNRGFIGAIALFVMKHVPRWLWRIFLTASIRTRPQAGFLPEVENKGSVLANVSSSTEKSRTIYLQRNGAVSL